MREEVEIGEEPEVAGTRTPDLERCAPARRHQFRPCRRRHRPVGVECEDICRSDLLRCRARVRVTRQGRSFGYIAFAYASEHWHTA